MRQLQRILFFLFFLSICGTSHSYTPLNTDDAGTTAKGSNQIEQYFFSILQVGQSNEGEDSISSGEDFNGIGDATAFPLTFARGLTDHSEVSFSPTYDLAPLGNFSRVGNYTVNYKHRFLGNGEEGLNLALKPSVIFPAGVTQQEFGIGNAAWNYGAAFIASQLWESAELHFNAGYMRTPYNNNYVVGQSADSKRANLYSISVAPVWKLSSSIKFAIDLGMNTNPNEPVISLTMYGQVAVIFSPDKNLDMGLSYQRNASNFAVAFGDAGPYTSRIQLGVTYRFD